MVLGLDRIGRSTSIKGNSRFVLQILGAVAQLNITPLIKKRNPVGKHVDNFLIPSFGAYRRTKGYKGKVAT